MAFSNNKKSHGFSQSHMRSHNMMNKEVKRKLKGELTIRVDSDSDYDFY